MDTNIRKSSKPDTKARVKGTCRKIAIAAMLISIMSIAAFAVEQKESETVTYLDYNSVTNTFEEKTLTNSEAKTEYITVTESDTIWGEQDKDTWYVVTGGTKDAPLTINHSVKVLGNVHLILTDECNIVINGDAVTFAGILVCNTDEAPTANTFTVYAQSMGDKAGCLSANGTGNIAFYIGGAGIGGSDKGDGSNITINGGNISAQGGAYGAGIGGGARVDDNCGSLGTNGLNITINGGNVIAVGGEHGAGIGGGGSRLYEDYNGDKEVALGQNIIINGGTVNATGGSGGAGIGGGEGDLNYNYRVNSKMGKGAYITINGGTVNADSKSGGAGIGGGAYGESEYITLNDGIITAQGGSGGAGIGGGQWASCCNNITINGGFIKANGGNNGAGIGGGYKGICQYIYINSGTITAKAGQGQDGRGAYGIGSGDRGRASKYIYVAANLNYIVSAEDYGTEVIAHTDETDISSKISHVVSTVQVERSLDGIEAIIKDGERTYYYEKLQDAVNAGNNKTVILTADVKLAGSLVVPEDYELNIKLDGHKITRASDADTQFSLLTNNGKILVSNGNSNSEGIIQGGVGADGGGICNHGTLTMHGVNVVGNSAERGGGIFNDGKAYIVGCTIKDNYGTQGGGIYNNGTLHTGSSIITDNNAIIGAGVYDEGDTTASGEELQGSQSEQKETSDTVVTGTNICNCTLSGNSGEVGTAVYAGGGNGGLAIKNSIVVDNEGGDELVSKAKSGITVDYVIGTRNNWKNVIKISGTKLYEYEEGEKLFADSKNGNYMLAAGSRAIDAGNNALIPDELTEDIEGDSRIIGSAVDIGADEYEAGKATPDTGDNNDAMIIYMTLMLILSSAAATVIFKRCRNNK